MLRQANVFCQAPLAIHISSKPSVYRYCQPSNQETRFLHMQHSRFYTIHPAHLNADCWAQQTPKEAQFQKHVHTKHVSVTGPMVSTPAKSLNLYVVQGIKDVGGGRCLLIQTR